MNREGIKETINKEHQEVIPKTHVADAAAAYCFTVLPLPCTVQTL
jgi:hypothetical protein